MLSHGYYLAAGMGMNMTNILVFLTGHASQTTKVHKCRFKWDNEVVIILQQIVILESI